MTAIVESRDQVVALYRARTPVAKIASQCGVTPGAIYYHLRCAGLGRPLRRHRLDKRQAQALYDQGLGDREIAATLQVDHRTIYKWRQLMNLPSRVPRVGGRSQEAARA